MPPAGQAAQLAASLDGSTALTTARLTGTVTRQLGDRTISGQITLEAQGTTSSRVDMQLGADRRVEIRGEANGVPWGAYTLTGTGPGQDGKPHAEALHNCWVPAVWFLPQLSGLSATHNDVQFGEDAAPAADGLKYLHKWRQLAHQSAAMQAEIAGLSHQDLGVDGKSLPRTLKFNLHPDKSLGRDIPIEVHYSHYQTIDGVRVPFHIQEFMGHTLLLDIAVSGAEVNPPLPASDFANPLSAP